MNKWNLKNGLWMMLYMVLYIIGSVLVCVTGAIHPVFFVCYQVTAGLIMTFSTFGYYGQIWFNRTYTYDCAIEEMPEGYAKTLMHYSPVWVFPVVIAIGLIVSIAVAYAARKILTKD